MQFLIYNIKRVNNIKPIKEIIEAIMAKNKGDIVNISIFPFLVISSKFGSARTPTPYMNYTPKGRLFRNKKVY